VSEGQASHHGDLTSDRSAGLIAGQPHELRLRYRTSRGNTEGAMVRAGRISLADVRGL